VLPFTSDEAWEFLPGANGSSVHLAVFPAGEPADTDRLERWATLLDARAEVTRALEAARAAKQIAASLEARVSVRGPEATVQALRAHDALSRVFPGNLANLFIVSEVRLEPGEGALEVSVEHAAGKKCERCWTWSPRVGTLASHPGVCERCDDVLGRS
jgi:isoleucyl-tRNA synthetase